MRKSLRIYNQNQQCYCKAIAQCPSFYEQQDLMLKLKPTDDNGVLADQHAKTPTANEVKIIRLYQYSNRIEMNKQQNV